MNDHSNMKFFPFELAWKGIRKSSYKKITIKNQEFEIEPISANIVTKDFFNPKKVQKGMRWPIDGGNTITWKNVTSVHEGKKPFFPKG